MLIPARMLRAYADDLPGAGPKFSARELDLQDRILRTAQHLFIRFDRASISFANLAAAMRLSPATLKRHFLDADCILFEILARHLRAIANAIGEVPHDAPELHKARREAYLAATRTAFNAPTEPHTLLLQARQTLPPDLLETIEALRAGLACMVGGPAGMVALTLLDTPELQGRQIEAMLAALLPPAEKIAPPAPSPPPRPMPQAPAPRKTRARPAAPQNQRSTRHARAGPADRFGGVAKKVGRERASHPSVAVSRAAADRSFGQTAFRCWRAAGCRPAVSKPLIAPHRRQVDRSRPPQRPYYDSLQNPFFYALQSARRPARRRTGPGCSPKKGSDPRATPGRTSPTGRRRRESEP